MTMSYFNSRHSTPERGLPSRSPFTNIHRSSSPSGVSDRQRNLSGNSGTSYSNDSVSGSSGRPGSAGTGRASSTSNIFNSPREFTDRLPRTRSKLSELPTFRESLRTYSPMARRSGEDILNDLKQQMKRESETFFNSNPSSTFSSFGPSAKVSLTCIAHFLVLNTEFDACANKTNVN